MAWAFGNKPVELWQPHQGGMPSVVAYALEDPFELKASWNATFERAVLEHLLRFPTSVSEWRDVMIQARYLSMPGYLEDVCRIVGFKDEDTKIADGDRLKQLFCMPAAMGGEETLFGISPTYWRDHTTDPEDWEKFCEYCRRDVHAERLLLKKFAKYPLPESEQRNWELDQLINERGIPTNMRLVDGAVAVAERAHAELLTRLKELTGLDNPNSRDQLLRWCRERGYPFGAMRKGLVRAALERTDLPAECREALQLRQQAVKTADTKLDALKNIISADSRLRHQFSFMGASRTGRWAGKDFQMQNLPRPTKPVEKRLEFALGLVERFEYDRIKQEFGNPLEVVGSIIRSVFQAPPGKKLVVCDLGAIENRGVGWVARCPSILNVFVEGRDPYLDFATKMYNTPYEELAALHKAKDPKAGEMRQNAKPAVLGCGYGLGGGEEYTDKNDDIIKGGLWGYAHAMGVPLTREQSHASVQIFRDTYHEVVQLWWDLEAAAKAALKGGRHAVGPVTFEKVGKILCCTLPSGRNLHYLSPKLEWCEVNGKKKQTIFYAGLQQQTRQWMRIPTYGGKLTENIVQAIARDILAHGMKLAEKNGLSVVAHVHDEIVCEADLTDTNALTTLQQCMTERPEWAKDLPLAAEGYESIYYKKG